MIIGRSRRPERSAVVWTLGSGTTVRARAMHTHLLVIEAAEQDDRHSQDVVRWYPSRVGGVRLEDKLVGAHLSQDSGAGGGWRGGRSPQARAERGVSRVWSSAGCGVCRVLVAAGCGVCRWEPVRQGEPGWRQEPGGITRAWRAPAWVLRQQSRAAGRSRPTRPSPRT